MEIQIPVADEDAGTESQLTDGTGYQTMSDNYSREVQPSSSAVTARSHATGSAWQNPVNETAEEGFENCDSDQDVVKSGAVVSADETQMGESGDANPVTFGDPGSGGDNGTAKDPDGSEKSYRSGSSVRSGDEKETYGGDAEIKTQEPSPDIEQTDQTLEEGDQTQEDDCAHNSSDLADKASEGNALDEGEGSEGCEGNNHDAARNEEEGTKTDLTKHESEEDRKVFLTENDNQEEGSDISDVRAETPDWAADGGEEGDRASLSDEDRVAQKQECMSMNSQVRPLTRSTLHEEIASGQRAVVNTPVSYYTTTEVNVETARNIESRNTSHVETAREAAFQRAMTLMSSRCESKQDGEEGGLFDADDTSYGYKYPRYFYVQQRKPSPMTPLKAWRGYHGNVYFEPIQISRVGGGKDDGQETNNPPSRALSVKSSASRRRTLTATTRSQAVVPVGSGGDRESMSFGDRHSPTRSTTRLTFRRGPTSAKSATSSRSIAAISQHHVLYLDKQVVALPHNSAMQEELQVMEKQRSTGSLNIQPRGQLPHDFRAGGGGSEKGKPVARRSGASSAKFDRICRGSVAHKLRRARSGGTLGNGTGRGNPPQSREHPAHHSIQSTELMVVGDKFSAASLMSPLLRTQTQFSLSNQRMTVNSPDLYGAFERLPPLEQVRISLRHMDAHGDEGFGNRVSSPYSAGPGVGVMEELKPFIKYSPDVKAQYRQQLKYY